MFYFSVTSDSGKAVRDPEGYLSAMLDCIRGNKVSLNPEKMESCWLVGYQILLLLWAACDCLTMFLQCAVSSAQHQKAEAAPVLSQPKQSGLQLCRPHKGPVMKEGLSQNFCRISSGFFQSCLSCFLKNLALNMQLHFHLHLHDSEPFRKQLGALPCALN